MYAPRRHSRRLLLPPGWVALGFLLLLACQALLSHRRQMLQERVLSLVMPFYSEKQAKKYETLEEHYAIGAYKPLASLLGVPHWRIINLTGKPLNDFFATAAIEPAVQALKKDTSSAGIQVVFTTGATYGNLVQLLNSMQRQKDEKYWLDIHGTTPILYSMGKAIKSKPIVMRSTPVSYQQDFCGTRDYQIIPPVTPVKTSLLEQPAFWRPALLLLLALIALSLYFLARPRPSLR
ncbi:MAG TPA: hypothetical protein VFO93_09085 [Hymenobacter sp.]|uniref:hypothetical protein n=1 Tax=Hymenobacter sp. TaxID=1898978 RepID=UPI002D809F3A|nr:hypothetical protein [Hymenobacter sp.]HET9503683.1 hypothetical protein [Hymenobacter sp.]